jgi:hypothetical protein
MAMIGKYCKSYRLEQLRQFPGWTENAHNARKIKVDVGGQTEEVERDLGDDDFLYLQENFTVTDGIFFDENIIFNNVTPEWIEFCQNTLEFKVPTDEIEAASETNADANSPPSPG